MFHILCSVGLSVVLPLFASVGYNNVKYDSIILRSMEIVNATFSLDEESMKILQDRANREFEGNKSLALRKILKESRVVMKEKGP